MNNCPTPSVLAALAPLSAQQVESVNTCCEFTGTDREKYQQWKDTFNWLPPPPPNGNFQPNFNAWVAANYLPE